MIGIYFKPKETLYFVALFLIPLGFYSLFWLFFGGNSLYGHFLWNYKYLLIPTLMLCALAGFIGQISVKWIKLLMPLILLALGLPLVQHDFETQKLFPNQPLKFYQIRSIELLPPANLPFVKSNDSKKNSP